jgi:uncharacterized protein involved in exopolysaccharide biosynthesis
MEEQKKHREIDVWDLIRRVLAEWRLLLKFIVVSAIIGVVLALCQPRMYTSEVVLAPEMSSGGLGMTGNLSDLASSFGIDIGKKSSMDAIYPELYPDVFASTDFILDLFNVPVRLKEDSTVRTYLNHLLEDVKIPFWKYPISWISDLFKKPEVPGMGKSAADPYRLSKVDTEIIKGISESIVCLIDKKTSEISISVTDQDPMVAAIMADTLQHRLQKYITEYRTKKARTDFEYYSQMVEESRRSYEEAQHKFAAYADSNNDLFLQANKQKLEQLDNDMQLQFTAYNQMVAQMKVAEAKIQERTPAFTVIQNAYMPIKPSSRRSRTLYACMLLGILLDSGWVLWGRNIYESRRRKRSAD